MREHLFQSPEKKLTCRDSATNKTLVFYLRVHIRHMKPYLDTYQRKASVKPVKAFVSACLGTICIDFGEALKICRVYSKDFSYSRKNREGPVRDVSRTKIFLNIRSKMFCLTGFPNIVSSVEHQRLVYRMFR